ncbi:MAG: ABC transporter permease [Lachnospiraceae bacterium]|nr:ABC transporter permease [Lachnospiraceae bacterium]
MAEVNNFLALVLQLSVPIVLGALCGTIAERGGIILLGVEGMMLLGAFAGVAGSFFTGSVFVGVLVSILVGVIVGWIYALFCLKWKAHQSVVGVGINLFASGITAVLVKAVWHKEGMSDSVNAVSNLTVPVLSDIPVIGALFKNQSPYLYVMFVIVAAVWVLFYRTKYGLRYRAIGDQPHAVQTAGINVNRYRYIAMMASGAIAGLAGSYLSLSQNNLFISNMTAGRGFMGLAANIFGGWQPLGSLGAGLVFSIAQAARFYLTEFSIPSQLVQMLPYIITLLILFFVGKRVKGPEALGKLVD